MIPKILEKGGEGDAPNFSAQIERFCSSLAIAAQLYFVGYQQKAGSSTPPSLALRLRSE
jgi:hypothetical protein